MSEEIPKRNALLGGVLLDNPVNLLYKPRTVEDSSNIIYVEHFNIVFHTMIYWVNIWL